MSMSSMDRKAQIRGKLLLKVVKHGGRLYARLDPVHAENLGLEPGMRLLVEIREVI